MAHGGWLIECGRWLMSSPEIIGFEAAVSEPGQIDGEEIAVQRNCRAYCVVSGSDRTKKNDGLYDEIFATVLKPAMPVWIWT